MASECYAQTSHDRQPPEKAVRPEIGRWAESPPMSEPHAGEEPVARQDAEQGAHDEFTSAMAAGTARCRGGAIRARSTSALQRAERQRVVRRNNPPCRC